MRTASTASARPIRTLLFSTLYPSSVRRGHGIFVSTRLKHLLLTGEVTTSVVAPVPWFPLPGERFGTWGRFAATPREEILDGIRVSHPRYLLPPKVGMSIAPVLMALGARRAIQRLRAEGHDFDLIDAHYYYPDGAAAALLARWFRKPFVVTARGTDLNLLPDYLVPRRWIRWAARRADASITVSQALKQRLLGLGASPEHVHVVRNGVDLDLFRPLHRRSCREALGLPDGRWLASIGNLVPLKGHDIAIQALELLPEDLHLAIVGEGGERRALEALARRLRVDRRVRFVGRVPQRELVHWYNVADVMILCSSREGLPNVVLEALACGTPVVATEVGGVPEVLCSPDLGRLIPARTPAALAAAVLNVLDSDADRSRLRQYAHQFSWAETARGQLELFHGILAPGEPAGPMTGKQSRAAQGRTDA